MLAKLGFKNRAADKLDVGFGVGIGGYIFHSTSTTTQIYTFVQDSEPWKTGDVRRSVSRVHLTAASPGAEVSIRLGHRLNQSVSLAITARALATSRIDDTWESTGYYASDWDPAQDELVTMTYGYQYGGIGWGIGASISF